MRGESLKEFFEKDPQTDRFLSYGTIIKIKKEKFILGCVEKDIKRFISLKTGICSKKAVSHFLSIDKHQINALLETPLEQVELIKE